jgi:hypothetical protein
VPKSWRVLYREGEQWKPVSGASEGGVTKDRFNKVTFAAVTTQGLRLARQKSGAAAGELVFAKMGEFVPLSRVFVWVSKDGLGTGVERVWRPRNSRARFGSC